MTPCLVKCDRLATAAVYEGVPELPHGMSEGKIINGHPASRRDPLHEPGNWGMIPSAHDVHPGLAQCDLENGEHSDQIGSFQIVMTIADIP